MRVFIITMALIMTVLASGIAFAGSCYTPNCYKFGNLNTNIFGSGAIEFKPFWSANSFGKTDFGTLSGNLGFDYQPIRPTYAFSNFDLGDLGLNYEMHVQPRFERFHIPKFDYHVPMRQIPTANVRFEPFRIPLKTMDLCYTPNCC